MSNTDKNNGAANTLNTKNVKVIVDRILFDTMYKKKITLVDWFYSKTGIISVLILVFLWYFDMLKTIHVIIWIIFALFMVQRTKIPMYAKDRELWGKILINEIAKILNNTERVMNNFETKDILNFYKKKKRVKRKSTKKKTNEKSN